MTTDENSLRSKKRLGASSNSKPLESLEIFIDRSLGRIAVPLEEAGAKIHLHDDYFEQDVDDQEWLTEVGKHDWIVLTKDKWIRRRAIEREALLNANLKVFCFMSGSIPFVQMAEAIAKALPRIAEITLANDPPFIAGVYKDSSARILLTRE